MPSPTEVALRRIVSALVAVSIMLVAFGSGLPASQAMGNVRSCAGMVNSDTGWKVAPPQNIEFSEVEAKAFAGTMKLSEPGKQSKGTSSTSVCCCGSFCVSAFSLADRHPGVTFSRGNEVWTAASNFLQPTEPSGSKRPPRASLSDILRAQPSVGRTPLEALRLIPG